MNEVTNIDSEMVLFDDLTKNKQQIALICGF